MVKSLIFKVKRSLEATTLIKHPVLYKENHVVTTFTVCSWLCQLNSCIDCLEVCILWTFKSEDAVAGESNGI